MTATPRASGYLAPSGAVVFPRRLPMSRDQAWAAVTDPARTARWDRVVVGRPGVGHRRDDDVRRGGLTRRDRRSTAV